MTACYKCGAELPPRERIFRSTVCDSCGAEARVCRNCHFYLPGAHWDCRETISEPVREKDRSNFCDHFRPRTSGTAGEARGVDGDGSGTARARFDSLFGDN